jgi:hypothetical protein
MIENLGSASEYERRQDGGKKIFRRRRAVVVVDRLHNKRQRLEPHEEGSHLTPPAHRKGVW